MHQIKKAIKLLDVFGTPITFNFDGKEKYTSFCGGMCTILIIAFILIGFQSKIQVFANREIMTSEASTDFFANPAEIVLDPGKFLFAVKVEQPTSYVERPFFVINVEQHTQLYINGTREKAKRRLALAPCKLEQFSNLSPVLAEKFALFQLHEFLCPDEEEILTLQGSYLSNLFQYVTFELNSCQSTSGQQKWDVPCASPQEIENYLMDQGQYRFVLYYTNSVVNPTSKDEFQTVYLSDDLTFAFQPKIKQQVSVFFKEYSIITDHALFLGQELFTEKIIYRDEGGQKIETVQDLQEGMQSPIIVYFKSDYTRNIAIRRFQKVDELLAYFGGLFHSSVLVVGIIVKMYNEIQFKVSMANKLYSFVNKSQVKNQFYANRNNFLRKLQEFNSKGDRTTGMKNQLTNLYRYFKESVLQKRQLHPELEYFLFLLSCKRRFISEENFLIEKSLQQILADMNVRVLMKRVQEIQKMKTIVFNESQLPVFNFMERPNLQTHAHLRRQSSVNPENEHHKKRMSKGQSDFRKLVTAYRELTNMKATDVACSLEASFTSKLFKSLGVEIQRILQTGLKIVNDKESTQRDEALLSEAKIQIPQSLVHIEANKESAERTEQV